MSITLAVAIFFLVWWIVWFAVLPWGVKGQHEGGGEHEPGTDPGAPQRPYILRKVMVTTLIAAAVVAVAYWMWTSGVISLERIPLPFALPSGR
jgi:predicted secreted protein